MREVAEVIAVTAFKFGLQTGSIRALVAKGLVSDFTSLQWKASHVHSSPWFLTSSSTTMSIASLTWGNSAHTQQRATHNCRDDLPTTTSTTTPRTMAWPNSLNPAKKFITFSASPSSGKAPDAPRTVGTFHSLLNGLFDASSDFMFGRPPCPRARRAQSWRCIRPIIRFRLTMDAGHLPRCANEPTDSTMAVP